MAKKSVMPMSASKNFVMKMKDSKNSGSTVKASGEGKSATMNALSMAKARKMGSK